MKITKTQILKALKKVNRELALEQPYSPSVVHKTSKKDKSAKIANTIRNWKDENL